MNINWVLIGIFGFVFSSMASMRKDIRMHSYQEKTIAVIGAGLAGLTLAYRLSSQGYNVKVYEARNRPGGRVFTYINGNSYEELGGANINDGGAACDIKNLIKELSLETVDVKRGAIAIVNRQAEDLSTFFAHAPGCNEEEYKKICAIAAYSSNMKQIVDTFFVDYPHLKDFFNVHEARYEGCDSQQIGVSESYVNNLWEFYFVLYTSAQKPAHLCEEFVFTLIKGGAYRLIEALCKKLEGKIMYNAPLTALSRKVSGKMALEIADNEKVEADYVVFAVPCSTLRDITLEKGLVPEDQLQAINSLQYGTNSKIIIPVIKLGGSSVGLASSPIAGIWKSFDGKKLILYYGGKSGVFDATNEKEILKKIKEMAPYISRLYPDMEYQKNVSVMAGNELQLFNSEGIVALSWANEPYSKGSYVCLAPGQEQFYDPIHEEYGEKVRTVFRSIKGKIFFAGEHTSIDVSSTMQGAVESGERIARMLKFVERIEN